jgi:chromosome segregation ATPase
VEDNVREVNIVGKQFPALKDELVELRRGFAEERERWTEQGKEIVKLAAQRQVDRDLVSSLEQNIGCLFARIDQLIAQSRQLTDLVERLADQQQGLDLRFRAERERIEGALRVIGRLEEHDGLVDGRIEQTARDFASLRRDVRASVEQIERGIADVTGRTDLRLVELERLQEEHKQREIAELEQQLKEMQERARQAKG